MKFGSWTYDGFMVNTEVYFISFNFYNLPSIFTVGSATHEPVADQQQHRRGDGPEGLLHLHRVGRDGGPGPEEREVLSLL